LFFGGQGVQRGFVGDSERPGFVAAFGEGGEDVFEHVDVAGEAFAAFGDDVLVGLGGFDVGVGPCGGEEDVVLGIRLRLFEGSGERDEDVAELAGVDGVVGAVEVEGVVEIEAGEGAVDVRACDFGVGGFCEERNRRVAVAVAGFAQAECGDELRVFGGVRGVVVGFAERVEGAGGGVADVEPVADEAGGFAALDGAEGDGLGGGLGAQRGGGEAGRSPGVERVAHDVGVERVAFVRGLEKRIYGVPKCVVAGAETFLEECFVDWPGGGGADEFGESAARDGVGAEEAVI